MSEAEAKTIHGKRVEIAEKGDWTTFHIDVGSQYPVRLSTKVKEVIDQARDFGTGNGTWHFKESQGNENPNKPGTYYTNRYLNKVEVDTGERSSASPETKEEVDWDGKDRRIVRQACLKVAASISNPTDVDAANGDVVLATITAAARLETWVYRGFDEVPFE